MTKRDYYDVLGFVNQRDVGEADLKAAYRRLAMKYHPDRNQGDDAEPDAEEKFKEAKEAFEILNDPRKRSAYDQFGLAGVSNQPPPPPRGARSVRHPFDDIFRGTRAGFTSVSVSGKFGNSSWSINHLSNVEVVVTIPLRTMIQGHQGYPVNYPYPVQGNITGIDRRTILLKISPDTPMHHQEIIENVMPDGGIMAIILVPIQDGGFDLFGSDIISEVAIDTLDAIIGGDLTVPHPSGNKMKIKMKPNTRDGMILKLQDKGLRRKDGSRGDFVVRITHHTKNYTDTQLGVLRKAIKQIREEKKNG